MPDEAPIIVFTERNPTKGEPDNPIPVEVPGQAGRFAEILQGLDYRFTARLTQNVVVLSIAGPLHPGVPGRSGVVASMAGPNDGAAYRAMAPIVIHAAYAQLFPGPLASA